MKTFNHFIALLIFASFSVSSAMAQTTAFTYQGKLTDSGNLANASYDMQFKLFDALTNGNQIGATLTFDGNSGNPPSVSVTNGIFTVSLDFGSAALSGADRYLEIGLKPAGNPGGYQELAPRQKLTSTPYAVQSLKATTATNTTQLGGVAASQYVQTNDARLSDARQPVAGSGNYIQNTTSQQATSNFNISGDGTAGGTLAGNVVNATAQYNLGGQRILSAAGNFNLVAGINAGTNNTTGVDNAFFGYGAGAANTTGAENAFFGAHAGLNSTGSFNSFFGPFSGYFTTGNDDSFFGTSAGAANTTGTSNSFFGSLAGSSNTTGIQNAFFGAEAGQSTTIGENNSFFGSLAGLNNTTGIRNAFFGANAGQSTTTSGSNSFFGYRAGLNSDGALNSFFGSSVGIGNTTGASNAFFGANAGFGNTTGSNNTAIGSSANVGAGNLDHATAIGADSVASLSNSIYLGRADGSDAVRIPGPVVINGSLVVGTLGSAGSTSICLNVANRIAPCSSSLRYKANVQTFTGGLDIIRRLRPITFTWKEGGINDVGFAAEEVQAIAPLLATYNKDGQIEGVKYGQITTVLVNAVKQQQIQIEAQQKQLRDRERQATIQQTQIERYQKQLTRQQSEIDALKQLLCHSHPKAEICTVTRRQR